MRKRKDPFLEAINFIAEEATPSQLHLLEFAVSYGQKERPSRKELRKKERTESST